MRKPLIQLLKLGISLSIITYLVVDIRSKDPAILSRLLSEPKEWNLLWAAYACFTAALLTTLFRWRFLVRAIGIELSIPEVVRLGLTAYMFGFVGFGAGGADLFKAEFLARSRQGSRARALASVIVDRVVGVTVLLVATSTVILATGLLPAEGRVRTILWATLLLSGLCIAFLVAICTMRPLRSKSGALNRLPIVGGAIVKLVEALLLYRARIPALGLAALLSAVTLGLNVMGFYLISSSLAGVGPSLRQHFVIVPLALVSGAIPLPMEALGALDYTLSYLYGIVSGGSVPLGRGLVVAMGYRVLGVSIAAVGACCVLSTRRVPGASRKA